MEKRFVDMIQVSAKGSMILVIGQMVSTLISAIGTVIIARVLGSTYYGVISIAQIPVNMSLLLLNNGVGSAMIKYLAENRYYKNTQNLRNIVLAGLSINTVVGFLSSITLYLTAGFISNQFFKIAELTQLIEILSVSVFFQSLVNTSYAVFTGYERMEIRSFINILFSVLKSVIGPSLVFFGYGAVGAAYGYTLPYIATGIIALALIFILYRNPHSSSGDLFIHVIKIARYSYPLFISNLLSGSLYQIFYFILPFYVSPSVIGNFTAAINFSVLVTLFTTPFNIAIFPLLSKLKVNDSALKYAFQSIVKYESMIVYPIAIAVYTLSDVLVEILYGATYINTPFFIKILMLNYLFIGLGETEVYNLLNSQKDTRVTLNTTFLTLLLGAPMGFYLIPTYGVLGLQITEILASKLGFFYALWWIKEKYRIIIDVGSLLRIAVSTLVGFILCRVIITLIILNPWLELFLGGGILFISYLLSLLLTGVLNRKNILDIQSLFTSYKRLNKLTAPLFALISNLSRD